MGWMIGIICIENTSLNYCQTGILSTPPADASAVENGHFIGVHRVDRAWTIRIHRTGSRSPR